MTTMQTVQGQSFYGAVPVYKQKILLYSSVAFDKLIIRMLILFELSSRLRIFDISGGMTTMDFHSLTGHGMEAAKCRALEEDHLTLIHRFHKLAQYHIQLAKIFYDHNQALPSLIFCERALASMLNALYIQTNNKPFPNRTLPMDELLHLLHTEDSPALDVVVFIGTVQYLATNLEREQIAKMKPKNVNRLLRRTDEVLDLLSTRITNDPSEHYRSIF
jgi:hypothetical protein